MGFALQLCFSTVISIGQSFIPNHIGLASGITIGMGSSVGAIIAPILGKVSDLYGLPTTFYVLIALSVITAVTGGLVPKHKKLYEQ
jgi:FSR family fosmidomycin resistance protein-like MFS transporter